MRILVLYAVIAGFMLYAWRNWFVSLCALIILTAIAEHEDMPRSLFELRGLSPWNGLFAIVFLAWLSERFRARRPLGAPKPIKILLPIYLVIMFVAVGRGLLDVESFVRWGPPMTVGEFLTENVINAVKFMIPGVLLFDACRTRKRALIATACILGLAVIDALLVSRRIPMSVLLGQGESWMVRRRVNAVTGLHANDVALILVISMWSILGFIRALQTKWRIVAFGAAGACALALGLCYSRAGFLACLAVGIAIGAAGSKRLLLLILFVVIPLGVATPGIRHRVTMGLDQNEYDYIDEGSDDALTAGRMTAIWPIALEGISRQPIIGHGRHAASRVLVEEFRAGYGIVPGHCHNAYLDMLLDAGLVGLIPTLALLGYLAFVSVKLIRSRGDPFIQAVGNMGLASVTAYMVMAMSGQRFFPTENLFLFYCIQGVMLRVYVSGYLQRRSGRTWPGPMQSRRAGRRPVLRRTIST